MKEYEVNCSLTVTARDDKEAVQIALCALENGLDGVDEIVSSYVDTVAKEIPQ